MPSVRQKVEIRVGVFNKRNGWNAFSEEAMFGHKSQPSRIWSFGAKAPVEGLEEADREMVTAHRYRNALCALERTRREQVDGLLRKLSPALVRVEQKLAALDAEIEREHAEMRRLSALVRKRVRPKDRVAALKTLKAARSPLYKKRQALRKRLLKSRLWKKEADAVEAAVQNAARKLRAESAPYWGTYLHVEQSCASFRRGAPPQFARWRGDGHLAVQIQKGISIADLFSEGHGQIHVETGGVRREGNVLTVQGLPGFLAPEARNWSKVFLRVGTKERRPVWAVVPVRFHREFPADARVKWVHLIRRRIATRYKWEVQFVLALRRGWKKPDRATTGAVGIEFGWRMREDGALRVARYIGTDGQEGELTLPADWLHEIKRTRNIKSIRDRNFDNHRNLLDAWLKSPGAKGTWLKAEAKNVKAWKAPARLAGLVIRWRDARVKGDAQIFPLLEEWRKRDRHLFEFQRNLEDQLQNRRLDLYRNFAATMRRRYAKGALHDLNLTNCHRLPATDEAAPSGAVREHSRDAAVGLLVRCLKESMDRTVLRKGPAVTKRCPACGRKGDFDRARMVRECPHCGDLDDQDLVVAKNLLFTLGHAPRALSPV